MTDEMIQVQDLNHINITTHDTDRAVEFYSRVLGLKEGPNPAFARRLRWMYQDDQPLVHISEAEEGWKGGGKAPFQHIAFRISNHDTAKQRVEELGIEHR
ncbi:MAG: VOC family protein, partial [Rhodospirillales bacterium]|nr:VOC family protein [Rhodospirillales bacterium]